MFWPVCVLDLILTCRGMCINSRYMFVNWNPCVCSAWAFLGTCSLLINSITCQKEEEKKSHCKSQLLLVLFSLSLFFFFLILLHVFDQILGKNVSKDLCQI